MTSTTTLESILFTFVGAFFVAILSILLFGITVQRRFALSAAPRCIARHPNTIYKSKRNRQNRKAKRSVATVASASAVEDDSQVRGNPFTGWINFVMNLSYDEMLMGVRGTGTRDEGYSGSLLKLNLDGIVLLRFHSLCLRSSFMITILAIGVLLPLNWTGSCHISSDGQGLYGNCTHMMNMTNYERTTIDNIVSFDDFELHGGDQSVLDPYYVNAWTRYYVIVFVSWIYAFYVCKILRVEWKEVLAIRRVFYLEMDHFKNRNLELAATKVGSNSTTIQTSTFQKLHERVKHRRNAEIPHPDSRDTVPNIELYTILVKGVPSMPSDVVESKSDIENLLKNNPISNGIDWQLAVTTSFFDHCIPAQPGFTSSVAAVTILPDASEIALAWRKWYAAAAILRRLRYVRSIIADLRYNYGYDFSSRNKISKSSSKLEDSDDIDVIVHDTESTVNIANHDVSLTNIAHEDNFRHIEDNIFIEEINRSIQDIGGDDVEEVEDFMLQALQFGPEQKAVYRREIAQSAAACCPFGCREERLRYLRIDDLIALEKRLRLDIVNASGSLRQAQRRAADSTAVTGNVNVQQSKNDTNHSTKSPHSTSLCDLRDNTIESTSYVGESCDNVLHETRSNRYRSNTDTSSRGVIENTGPKRLNFNSESRLHSDDIAPDFIKKSDICRKNEISNGHAIPNFDPNESPPVRRRITERTSSDSWQQVRKIRDAGKTSKIDKADKENFRRSGVWGLPKLSTHFWKRLPFFPKKAVTISDSFNRNSSFAVVTFTSRQAAVTARHCLVDGRGSSQWMTMPDIPTPPLADSSPWDIRTCRGCCRPVTLTISERQQFVRRTIAYIIVTTMFVFYTLPISYAVVIITENENESNFQEYVPDLLKDFMPRSNVLSGIASASLFMLFFALCPIIFKAIAMFGSNATSALDAEKWALSAYWWFMVVTAFSGSSILNMVLAGIEEEWLDNSSVNKVMNEISSRLAREVASTWINWIILRTLIILPGNYLLQFNTILFHCLGWKCCSRAVRGGGPGGHTPYRIYIDSGVVFLCTVSLSIVSPLIAPCALLYFLFCTPLWRRQLIFVYRPKFDGGGTYWPFLFDMFISSLFVMQILLCTVLSLKKAFITATLALAPIVPTWFFRKYCVGRFLRSYEDVGLMQSSLLDEWAKQHQNTKTSFEERERYRSFLVDAHKAAYIPICISEKSTTNIITTEPAQVECLESDNYDHSLTNFSFETATANFSLRQERLSSPNKPTIV